MKHIPRILILFILILGMVPVFGQEVITLRAALDSTLSRNLQIRQADYQTALGAEDLLQSRMDLLPSLGAGLGAGWNGGNFFDERTATLGNTTNKSANGSLNLSVTLFQGLQRINQIAANKYLLEADKSNAARVRNELQLSVVTTYVEALTNRDLWEAAQQQLALSREQLSLEEVNVEVGTKTLADLSQARSQVATDELNVTSARNAYELSLLTLKQFMEMDPAREITLETPPLPDVAQIVSEYTAGAVYARAVSIFPEIRQARFSTLAAERNVQIAKGGYYPTLSLSGGLGTGYTTSARDTLGRILPFHEQLRNTYSQNVGLSLSIPIFSNLRTRIGIRKARISYQNAQVQEQQARNELNKAVNQAVLDLRAAEQRYRSSEQAFESNRETFNVIKQRYDVGLATAIELSTAQTNMNRAEFDFISSRYNLIFRSKVIDYYMGKSIRFD